MSKDELIEKQKDIIEDLWQIIDDIDTAGDIAKGDDSYYRKMVERLQKKRFDTGINSDGYKLIMPWEVNNEVMEAYTNLPNEHCTILQDQVFTESIWTCTKELRWYKVKTGEQVMPVSNVTNLGGGVSISNAVHQTKTVSTYSTVLQQKWISQNGEEEWRDIPEVVGE